MDNYIVKVWTWSNRNKGKIYGPDFIFSDISAENPELALRKVLQENKINYRVYAEVIWNNELDRQKFEDYSL